MASFNYFSFHTSLAKFKKEKVNIEFGPSDRTPWWVSFASSVMKRRLDHLLRLLLRINLDSGDVLKEMSIKKGTISAKLKYNIYKGLI